MVSLALLFFKIVLTIWDLLWFHTDFRIVFSSSVKYSMGNFDRDLSACNEGDLGLIPGSGRSPGERNGNPLQCSCLENPRDRAAWWAAVYGVAQSRT